ncbi:unnamed protein product, partial [Scytosiphon promiscuus]
MCRGTNIRLGIWVHSMPLWTFFSLHYEMFVDRDQLQRTIVLSFISRLIPPRTILRCFSILSGLAHDGNFCSSGLSPFTYSLTASILFSYDWELKMAARVANELVDRQLCVTVATPTALVRESRF